MTTPKFEIELIKTDKNWHVTRPYITFKESPNLNYLNTSSIAMLRNGNINFLCTLTWQTKEYVEELYDYCFNRLCYYYKENNYNPYNLHDRTLLEMKRLLK
jgi:hypothetical protein